MRYAYKCVAAPRRTRRKKGHRTAGETFCASFEELLNEHGAAGWEYVRTDLVPMEAREGLFARMTETHQGVVVFRRALGRGEARPSAAEEAEAAAPAPAPAPERAEPAIEAPPLGAARID